jgi:orotidine-5'-phosphate decarboxylase
MRLMALTFLDKFALAAQTNSSRLCVGLDPDPARIPGGDVVAFNRSIIEATADLVCCYKPNIAFYEQFGRSGFEILKATIDAIPDGIPVLLDAKRGDIDSTARAYAVAMFDALEADAVTVNPYPGGDSLKPFLERADKGIFILCRTSNPGAADLQDLPVMTPDGETEPLYLNVAARAAAWNRNGNIGLVVGATYPDQLRKVRERCPELPVLIPGIGPQRGALEESVRAAFNGSLTGFLVNSSRSVLYGAVDDQDVAEAARAEALRVRNAINLVLGCPVGAGG